MAATLFKMLINDCLSDQNGCESISSVCAAVKTWLPFLIMAGIIITIATCLSVWRRWSIQVNPPNPIFMSRVEGKTVKTALFYFIYTV